MRKEEVSRGTSKPTVDTNPGFAELDPVIDRTVSAISSHRERSDDVVRSRRRDVCSARGPVERLLRPVRPTLHIFAYPEQAAELSALVDALQGPFKESAAIRQAFFPITQLATLNREFTNLSPRCARLATQESSTLDTAGQGYSRRSPMVCLGVTARTRQVPRPARAPPADREPVVLPRQFFGPAR